MMCRNSMVSSMAISVWYARNVAEDTDRTGLSSMSEVTAHINLIIYYYML